MESTVAVEESFDHTQQKQKHCNFTPYMLMVALSIHSIFEGIATGIQKEFGIVLDMIIAILVHKGAAGSALGINLVKNFPNDFKLVRQLVFLFSIATPLGVVIGMFCSNSGTEVNVVMSSLAAGTFIYIGCTEIVVHEFAAGTGYKWTKMFAYLFGATVITCLCFMENS